MERLIEGLLALSVCLALIQLPTGDMLTVLSGAVTFSFLFGIIDKKIDGTDLVEKEK